MLLDRGVPSEPGALTELAGELQRLAAEHGALRVGIDVLGGIAGLLAPVLVDASIEAGHVSGLAVDPARQGGVKGERRSDAKDAGIIADQVRHRPDLRAIDALTEIDTEIRLLVGRRPELVTDQLVWRNEKRDRR